MLRTAPVRYLGSDYPSRVPTSPSLPAAVMWDMDGTLVDTEPYWIHAELELAERDGGHWTHEDGLTLVGNDLIFSAQQLRERGGIKGTDLEIVNDLLERVIAQVREHGIPWRPGAQQLLQSITAAGIPCALVTMSYANLAGVVAEALPAGTFSAIVTGDMVANGKPHPEPYLTAAAALGVEPAECVALEDSVTGITSAEAAGMKTLGVKFVVPIPAAPKRSRVDSLEQVTVEDLRSIAAGTVIDLL